MSDHHAIDCEAPPDAMCGWCRQPQGPESEGLICDAAPLSTNHMWVHKDCLVESHRIAHGERRTAEEIYDDRVEAGADDWKADEGR